MEVSTETLTQNIKQGNNNSITKEKLATFKIRTKLTITEEVKALTTTIPRIKEETETTLIKPFQ